MLAWFPEIPLLKWYFSLKLSPALSVQHYNQVNVTQANPQPLQWACPNANYLAQNIELDLNMQFFWLTPTHCAAKKINSNLAGF
jgi:hypothetical protein